MEGTDEYLMLIRCTSIELINGEIYQINQRTPPPSIGK